VRQERLVCLPFGAETATSNRKHGGALLITRHDSPTDWIADGEITQAAPGVVQTEPRRSRQGRASA